MPFDPVLYRCKYDNCTFSTHSWDELTVHQAVGHMKVYLLIEHEPKSDYPVCIIGVFSTPQARTEARWRQIESIRVDRPTITIYGESVCECGKLITEDKNGWTAEDGSRTHIDAEREGLAYDHEPQDDTDDWDLELIEESATVRSYCTAGTISGIIDGGLMTVELDSILREVLTLRRERDEKDAVIEHMQKWLAIADTGDQSDQYCRGLRNAYATALSELSFIEREAKRDPAAVRAFLAKGEGQ